MNRKEIFYILIFFIGLFAVIVGLLQTHFIRLILPLNIIITSFDWIIIIGIFFTFIGLLLLLSSKYNLFKKYMKVKTLEVFFITLLLIFSAVVGGWLYGQYQKTLLVNTKNIERISDQLKMMNLMGRNNPFYSKKVIIRDDDIGNTKYLSSLEWIADLVIDKNLKLTLAIIPSLLVKNPRIVDYLLQLDTRIFEFAVHGYEHIHFKDKSYETQYSMIENGTKMIQNYLDYTPYTFIPPQGSGDLNTTKALRSLGYHSITDWMGYPSYITNFISDFEYEKEYDPPEHYTYEENIKNFDDFYNSSDEYYVLYLHDWTFLDNEGYLDEEKTMVFEKVIEYIKGKNVQFMTIDEAYQWHIDENVIRYGMINENHYFIDLKECQYNHNLKFNSPSDWNDDICLIEYLTGEKKIFYHSIFEFKALSGNLYEIILIEN
jgi:peptidoglycan/xylan/chitin deacetylase (PgdA/CDA1 family)